VERNLLVRGLFASPFGRYYLGVLGRIFRYFSIPRSVA